MIDKHEPGGYVTPYEAAGEDATYISRIREDATVENGLVLWCVSDNLRKGAALNAIQIAEVPDQPQTDQRQEKGGVRISSGDRGSRNAMTEQPAALPAQSDAEARRARASKACCSTAAG